MSKNWRKYLDHFGAEVIRSLDLYYLPTDYNPITRALKEDASFVDKCKAIPGYSQIAFSRLATICQMSVYDAQRGVERDGEPKALRRHWYSWYKTSFAQLYADQLDFSNIRALSMALCERIALELSAGATTLPFGLRGIAKLMKRDLMTRRLRVTLIPSRIPEVAAAGGCIRQVEEDNPTWYRMLCKAFEANRTRPRRRKKHDTTIKRAHVIRALDELARGVVRSEYAQRLTPYLWRYNDND